MVKHRISYLTSCDIIMQYVVISIVYLREYCLFLGLIQVASWLYILAFITFSLLLFLVFVNNIRNRFKRKSVFLGIVTILLIASMLLSATKSVGLELIEKGQITISQILLLLFFLLLPSIKSNKGLFCYVCKLNVTLSLTHIVMSFIRNSYYNGYLVYFYASPNESGLSIYLTSMYLFVYAIYSRGLKKYLLFILLLYEIALCYLSGSRASLFSALIALSLYFVLVKKKSTYISPNLITAIIVLSVIFPFIYVGVFKFVFNKNVIVLGKPIFSGREVIWEYIIETVISDPLKTHYKESIVYRATSGYERDIPSDYGAHNAFWGILWNYNIIILLLTIWILNFTLREAMKHVDSKFKLAIGSVIVSLFFIMTFETSLLSAGFNYMFRAFYLLVFLRNLKL